MIRRDSRSYKKWATLILSAPAAMSYGVLATAQTSTAPQAQGGGLEEIVVTAQRRSQSIQDVPIAISAVTGAQLDAAGITNVGELSQLAPGLRIPDDMGVGTAYIRGVGSGNAAASAEGDVAIYVDDVYYGDPNGALMSLSNVERVEVLKGPQGTLYGRNAVGGLINIITPQPEVAPRAKADIAYESFHAVVGSIYVTGGVERLQGSLSIDLRHQGEGYGHLVSPGTVGGAVMGQEVNFQEYQNYRGKLAWEPSDADRVTLSAGYFRNPGDYGFAGNIYPGTVLFTGETPASHPWDSKSFYGVPYTQTKDVALHWNHDFANGAVFKSITAYREVFFQNNFDLVIPVFTSGITKKDRAMQQEFLLQGKTQALSHEMEYTTGVFIYDMKTLPYFQTFGFQGAPPILDTNQRSATRSYAVYGQVDYHLTQRDTVTVGGRYTWDKQQFRATDAGVSAFPPTANFGEPTWRAALKHQLSEQWMVYGSYSRGYKSGLYDNSTIEADGSVNLLKPEFLTAYEIGTKGTFWDGNLQVGLNGFYWDYKNIQVQYFSGAQILLQNAGAARIYGVEPEITAAVPVPVGKLQLHATGSIYSNKYTEFAGCTINTPQAFPPGGDSSAFGNCAGNHLPYAPEQEVSASADYRVDLPIGGNLDMRVDFYHSGTMFFGADNTQKQDSYNLVNAQIAYALADNRTRLRVYGKNLGNKLVVNYGAQGFFGGFANFNPPRIFGVGLEYSLD